ncbi:hypothetical protein HNQ38_000033 [Desulfovibrio intestinalis]|uniref:Uncharacterized protein n=1 Tax=Desulfovibrio intestinalis TaxID=58621 RepID=A0A7W8BXW7_9BACT|nr:hypothetical protein [Desulfovibrio intestinalis]
MEQGTKDDSPCLYTLHLLSLNAFTDMFSNIYPL